MSLLWSGLRLNAWPQAQGMHDMLEQSVTAGKGMLVGSGELERSANAMQVKLDAVDPDESDMGAL